MKSLPKISIVTPNYQTGHYLEACMQSILQQNYPHLEYIIIDGGSTDGSMEVIKKYEKKLHYWVSEKDQGLYHALQKGFAQSSGEIMGWLNADDLLHPNALFTLAEIFQHIQQVKWLQGWPTVFDAQGRTVFNRAPVNSLYFFLSKKFLTQGTFIQQESTYWHRDLWEQAGGFITQEYSLAGDFELWMRFFQHEPLYLSHALIGGFRAQGTGQLSRSNYQRYLDEAVQIIDHLLPGLDSKIAKNLKVYQHYHNIIRKIPFIRSQYARRHADIIYSEKFLQFEFTQQKFYQ